MGNTEQMIKSNKKNSRFKVNESKKIIAELLKNKEKVTVAKLVKMTGFSRAFFYNNAEVRMVLDRAKIQQEGKLFIPPQKVAIDKALERKVELLEQKIAELRSENERLSKKANSKTLEMIESL